MEFHTHCNTGLGALCCLEVIQLGFEQSIQRSHRWGIASSNPSVFNVVMNERSLGYHCVIDEEAIKPVRDHFTALAKSEKFPIGKALEYDDFHPLHQLPGGMISNFRFQLSNLGRLEKLPELLEEVIRVGAEFGYPIMVTPHSQFFGIQAAVSVIVGERYKEILLYALGWWGDEEAESVEPNLRDKLLNHPRAEELAGFSYDEAMLRYFAGDKHVAAIKLRGHLKNIQAETVRR